MKIRWNQEYNTRTVYVIIAACVILLFFAILLNLAGIFDAIGLVLTILSPFLWGFAIAYILNRPMIFFETKVFAFVNRTKPRPRLARGLAVVVVMLIFLAILVGLIWIIIPQLIESLSGLIRQLPEYFQQFSVWVSDVATSVGLDGEKVRETIGTWEDLISRAIVFVNNAIPSIADTGFNITMGVLTSIANFFIALIAAIYLLSSKESFILQSKKLGFAIFPKRFAEQTVRLARESHTIFAGFITGKLLEALIVGVITFIALTIINIPYALLISVIMGAFNLIPFFGPFIGAIPCVLLLLLVHPMDAVWFIVVTIVLQQIDGQIIGPKILGEYTGLTAFWVIFAIVLGGGLCGVLGMLLGVPVFAVVYSLVKQFVDMRLRKKGLSTKAYDYRSEK